MRNTTLATLRKHLVNYFWALLLLALPMAANAAGLGKLTVLSALGQPLRAEVELSASREELSSLTARIASPNAFQQAGIEYSQALSGIRFIVGQRPDAQPFLSIQSDRPFNEPFLDLLVELNWSSGRLVREYTFLLDPPEALKKPLVAPAAPPQLPEIKREAAPAIQAPPAPSDETVQKKPQPFPEMKVIRGADGVQRIVKVEPQNAPEKPALTRLVKRGDTLGKIAAETKPEGVNLDQMLVALFRGNQEAFVGNVNRLKAGKILAIPDRETVASVNADEARKTIQAHAADFNAYSKRLASSVAGSLAAQGEPKRAVSGKIAPRVEDKPPASAAKDKLEVSKAEVAQDSAGKAGATRLAAIEETLISREKALKDANSRIAELDKNLNDLKKLVELKNQGLADLQKQAQAAKPAAPAAEVKKPEAAAEKQVDKLPPAADQKPAEPGPAAPAAPALPPVTKPAAAEKLPAPPVPPVPSPAEPSFIDDSPEIVYGSGGILILLLGYLGYSRWRKQRQADSDDGFPASLMPGGDSRSREAASEILSPTGISGQTDLLGNEAIAAAVDPVAEADVYLAHGRDVQAEEILVDALKSDPKRHAIHLKLLEIYAKRKSVKQFETIAIDLHGQTGGSGPDWEKAIPLGRQVDPENPLYAGKAGAQEEFDPSATLVIQPKDVLADFEVAETSIDTDTAVDNLTPQNAEVAPDIEVTSQEEVPVSLDFDFSLPAVSQESASTESLSAPLPESGALDIDFDLDVAAQEPATPGTSGIEPDSSAPIQADSSSEADAGLDFDFDLGGDQAPEISVAAPELADSNLINFDLELPAAELPEPAAAIPAATNLDLSSISLDLDEPPASTPLSGASPSPELDDAALQDVATKLELAQAYEEMGDKEGARELLQEVLTEGNAAQQETARDKLAQLG